MSRAGSLCRDLGTLVKRNKNQLYDYMTTEPARVCLACLRSCVLRAYRNFESKQAMSISLLWRRPNNNQLLSQITHVHYRETVPLRSVLENIDVWTGPQYSFHHYSVRYQKRKKIWKESQWLFIWVKFKVQILTHSNNKFTFLFKKRFYGKTLPKDVAAPGKRSQQWCLTLTPNNTKTIERMTCPCFLRPVRGDLPSSSYTTLPKGRIKWNWHKISNSF